MNGDKPLVWIVMTVF